MAYYTTLIAAWNNPTQPPPGVTGTGLTGGMTTAQKLAAVNAWTVAAPEPAIIPTYKIYNVIVRTEFDALNTTLQQSVRDILNMGTVDGSPGTQIRARMVQVFPSSTQTFANLQTLVAPYDNVTKDWCFANNYPTHGSSGPGNLSQSDCNNAGLV